jgi:hypothetical protein
VEIGDILYSNDSLISLVQKAPERHQVCLSEPIKSPLVFRNRVDVEEIVRMRGTPDFVGAGVDIDRLLRYQVTVAAPEFFCRARSQPKPVGSAETRCEVLMEAAGSGEDVLQLFCGNRFRHGTEARQDLIKAVAYFRVPADQGKLLASAIVAFA